VFTAREVSECSAAHRPAAAFAGRFAVKEALIKALGGTLVEGFEWRDLEVVGAGADLQAELHGAVGRLAEDRGVRHIRVSASSTAGMVAAVAVLES
jgi:holo-[acyl-carrier protein] synthase